MPLCTHYCIYELFIVTAAANDETIIIIGSTVGGLIFLVLVGIIVAKVRLEKSHKIL